MLIEDPRAILAILTGSSDGSNRCTVYMIGVNGRAASANGSRVSVATKVRSENDLQSASLCQSSTTHGPMTPVASPSRSASSAGGMPNNCHDANGLKKIPNSERFLPRQLAPWYVVRAPIRYTRGETIVLPLAKFITGRSPSSNVRVCSSEAITG